MIKTKFRIVMWRIQQEKGIGEEFTVNIKNKGIGHPLYPKLDSRFRGIHYSFYYYYSKLTYKLHIFLDTIHK